MAISPLYFLQYLGLLDSSFFSFISFSDADLIQNFTDHGRQKRLLLYLTVATKSSNFFVTFTFPTYPVHK